MIVLRKAHISAPITNPFSCICHHEMLHISRNIVVFALNFVPATTSEILKSFRWFFKFYPFSLQNYPLFVHLKPLKVKFRVAPCLNLLLCLYWPGLASQTTFNIQMPCMFLEAHGLPFACPKILELPFSRCLETASRCPSAPWKGWTSCMFGCIFITMQTPSNI